MGNVLSAFDPTTGRGIANIATGGMYELTKQSSPALNPVAAALGGKLDTTQPSVNGASPTPYYAARYDPKTVMPQYSRKPGDVSGYALNPHQKALVDALKNRPVETQTGPGISEAAPSQPAPQPQPQTVPSPLPGGGTMSQPPPTPSPLPGGAMLGGQQAPIQTAGGLAASQLQQAIANFLRNRSA